MRLIRITRHPHDQSIAVLATPPDLATDMGRFEAARYAPDLRAYMIHVDTVPALRKFAKHLGVHVIDERRDNGPRTLPHECGDCGQPGSVERPPRCCPDCGADWRPVTYEDAAPTLTEGTCGRCGHRQGGRFPRCSHCGGHMAYPERGPRVEIAPRAKLPDPIPLAEAIAETPELQRAALNTPGDRP
jgi:hypothetical protein